MPNILITTLGGTWKVVPELLGFTNPGQVDFYKGHPDAARFSQCRRAAGISPVNEVWLISTEGAPSEKALAALDHWHQSLAHNKPFAVHILKTAGIEDPATEEECRYMAECIFRVVLRCSELKGDGQLLISLAGGRKTMSADIQNAAMLFGCDALLHVIQAGNDIRPLVVGQYRRNPLLDVEDRRLKPITSERFPFTRKNGRLFVSDFALTEDIWDRQKTAGFLYSNHTNRLMQQEKISNFLALYNLPPALIKRMKTQRVGINPATETGEMAWLSKLPKAELHCHLGGVADAGEMIEMAAVNLEQVKAYEKALSEKLREWRDEVDAGLIGPEHFKSIRTAVPGVPPPVSVSAFILLFEKDPKQLDQIIFKEYQNPEMFCAVGIDAYERLGDLQGSGLLQSEGSLRAVCRILLRKARAHHVKHLEVRCSPINYVEGGLRPENVARIIEEELSSDHGLNTTVLFIASRHGKMSKVHEHIELAESLMEKDSNGFPNLCGFDLAGNERSGQLSEIRRAFMPMMEKCMHFTIHAGETENVQKIWEAVYHLNAERVGHGLKLLDNPRLMDRFKDRKIAIEMCPSSNFQIVGFQDNYLPETGGLKLYPLKKYLDAGLRVTVNTDNPGISRTDFTLELHRAARLTPGGLSLWEILLLIRNSFRAAFTGSEKRHQLIREAEAEIIRIIHEGLPDES